MTLPIIHELSSLYKELYAHRNQVPKLDRFALYARIENVVLVCLETAIKAALTAKDKKLGFVQGVKINIEVGKRLTRLAWELKIIPDKKYILFEQQFQQASKMASGWIKYLNKGP